MVNLSYEGFLGAKKLSRMFPSHINCLITLEEKRKCLSSLVFLPRIVNVAVQKLAYEKEKVEHGTNTQL